VSAICNIFLVSVIFRTVWKVAAKATQGYSGQK